MLWFRFEISSPLLSLSLQSTLSAMDVTLRAHAKCFWGPFIGELRDTFVKFVNVCLISWLTHSSDSG